MIRRNRGRGIYRAPITIDDGPDKMLTTCRWKCLITGITGSTRIPKGDVNLNVPPDFQSSLIPVSPLKVHSKSNLDLCLGLGLAANNILHFTSDDLLLYV